MQFALRYLSVAGGLVALAVLLVIAQTDRSLERNVSSLAEARLRLVLASMGSTIQANLDFGLPLASLRQIQELLERTLAKQPGLRAIDVIGDDGTSLFSSDRGAEGEPAPAPWLAAMQERRDGDLWRAQDRGELAVGLPIVSDIGRTVGHVVLVRPAPQEWQPLSDTATALLVNLPLAAAAGLVAGLGVAWLVRRRHRRLLVLVGSLREAHTPHAATEDTLARATVAALAAAAAAGAALAACRAELERIDHEG
jgi:hypothetical protein